MFAHFTQVTTNQQVYNIYLVDFYRIPVTHITYVLAENLLNFLIDRHN